MHKYRPKDQIAYVPTHIRASYGGSYREAIKAGAEGIEYGFVTSARPSQVDPDTDIVFCRFWSPFGPRLRTSANSEGCSPDDLMLHKCTEDFVVEAICCIKEYGIALGSDPPAGRNES